jgi:hypothetical protein
LVKILVALDLERVPALPQITDDLDQRIHLLVRERAVQHNLSELELGLRMEREPWLVVKRKRFHRLQGTKRLEWVNF